MPLHFLSTVIRRCTKITLVIMGLLFSTTGLKAQEAIYLKNRWTNEYIGYWIHESIPGGKPAFYMSTTAKKTLWFVERVDDTYVLLKNKEGLYLNVEKGYLEASKVPASFFSAQWKLPAAGGYNTIINRWTGVYIHNEYGRIEATKGSSGWYSAQWAMEDADGKPVLAKDFSLNTYTSFLPNQQMYYKMEKLTYSSAPLYLDINRAKSSDLAIATDYGGDNGGKAWKFTLVSDGWYKISNLKLGGNKVLAIAKNTNGTYYFVLTDFANYPNQLWRMIQFKDQTLINYVTEKKLQPEKFASMHYTLVSKQHGLEPIKALADMKDNPKFFSYGFNLDLYLYNPFDLFWQVKPVDDIAAIRNIPLNTAEQNALLKESIDNSTKVFNEAMLKATPIAQSPFKMPVGRIKGAELPITPVGGRDLSALYGKNEREYTQEEWDNAVRIAGTIPIYFFNNTNTEIRFTLTYTDQWGQPVTKNYKPMAGKNGAVYLDPLCTYILLTATDPATGKELCKSNLFYRSKAVKIYLDGTVNDARFSVWNW
ncbi:MAG: RICIN domain-containing protein [Sphingobacteriales bacterium]|nr:RICIN domain-containing protein [Sphingobacteriales bacterium]